MADQNTNVTDPYAAYGGSVASPSASFDPYAAYGGSLATGVATAPQPPANPASESQMFDATTGGAQATHRYDPTTKSIIPMDRSTVGSIVQGVQDSSAANLVKDAIAPPTSAGEHAILGIAGPGALIAVRQAKSLMDSAQNLVKTSGAQFPQAIADFNRAVQDYHRRDYRNAASSAASTVADMVGATDPTASGVASQTRELSEAARPGEDLASPLTRQVVDAGAALASEAAGAGNVVGDVAEAGADAASKAASKVKEAPSKVVQTAEDIKPEWLTKREPTPAAQHGTPVPVESPLDSATVGKQLGGKDLSVEALSALQNHIGEQIPVGSSARNRLVAAVEPVSGAIDETASKMNKIVADAPGFTTSTMQDSVFGEGTLTKQFEDLKANLPASDKLKLSEDADAVLEDADKALNSTDPVEILEYRRQLGKQIDWDDIQKNPATPKEVQNAARAKVYQQLTRKIHEEIPSTVELDKILQPNLELRSHLKRKVGERLVDDPIAATSEAQSEFKKGKTQIENAAHNDQVAKNWQRIKYGLIAAGVGSGVIHAIDKALGL